MAKFIPKRATDLFQQMQNIVRLSKCNSPELVLRQQSYKFIHERVVEFSKDCTRWRPLKCLAGAFNRIHFCALNVELPDISRSVRQNGIDGLHLYPL